MFQVIIIVHGINILLCQEVMHLPNQALDRQGGKLSPVYGAMMEKLLDVCPGAPDVKKFIKPYPRARMAAVSLDS